jgi:hypothetical protein
MRGPLPYITFIFISQLSVATSRRLVYPINKANSADRPHAQQTSGAK